MPHSLPPSRRAELVELAQRSREAVLLTALVGVLTGAGVAAFEWVTIDVLLDHVLEAPPWLVPVIPLAGLALAAVALRLGGGLSPATSDEYVRNYHELDDLALRPVPWRIVAAALTLGSGAPGGLEGPSMYLGSGVGTALQRRFRRVFGARSGKQLMVAGAAAGVAAIFKAPATGAVYALEVPYRDDLGRHQLIPALVGAASGYLAFVSLTDTSSILAVHGRAPFDLRDLAGAVGLGIAVGIVVRGFAAAIRWSKRIQRERPVWLTVLAGGAVIAAVTVIAHLTVDRTLALGPGYTAIEWAVDPAHSWVLVALLLGVRLIGTLASIVGGGAIGLFVPLVVVGALLGRLAAAGVGATNVSLFVIVGVAAALGAGYRVPLAGVTFVAEATGRPGFVVPGLLAAVCADLLMGTSSVTAYQRSGVSVDEEH